MLPPFEHQSPDGTLLLDVSRSHPTLAQWATVYQDAPRFGLTPAQVLLLVPPGLRHSVITYGMPGSPWPALIGGLLLTLALACAGWLLLRRLSRPHRAVFAR